MKNKLPVIILNSGILLPNNEIELKIFKEENINNIDTSLTTYNSKIIIVNDSNNNDILKLPKIAVLARIVEIIEKNDNDITIKLSVLNRTRIFKYIGDLKERKNILAIFEELNPVKIEDNNDYIFELKESLARNICNSNINCSILKEIENINDFDILTDKIANVLELETGRKIEYLNEISYNYRLNMLLNDIKNINKKTSTVSQNIENEVNLDVFKTSIKNEEVANFKNILSKLNLDEKLKIKIEKEIDNYLNLNENSIESKSLYNYLNLFINLPWNQKKSDSYNIRILKKSLNESHFSHDEVKKKIIEYFSVKMFSNVNSNSICLVGPNGVGKNNIINCIANSLDLNTSKIDFNEIINESQIIGNKSNEINSTCGKIIDIIKLNGTNSIIVLDSIDKININNEHNIVQMILDLLDNKFIDKYVNEFFNLSNVIFILTASSYENIPAKLKEKLEILELDGYTENEKKTIFKNYMLKKVCSKYKISSENINFEDEAITSIIRNYTNESGIDILEKQLEKIIKKIITSLVSNNIKVSKLNITKDNLDKYLGDKKYEKISSYNKQIGTVNALSYTNLGDKLVPIEATFYKGTGKIKITGSYSDNIKDLSEIAMSFIKTNHKKFDIDYDVLLNSDIHIDISTKKEFINETSLSLSIITSIISALKDIPISNSIAMSGSITLKGIINPTSRLKDKCIAAINNNIDTVFISKINENDVKKLSKDITENIKIIFINDYFELFEYLKSDQIKQ